MSTTVVISQPMYFPWVGLFEQIALADVYVHYTDVQFSRGSFTNRVQVKTPQGSRWMTVPLRDLRLGQHIDEVQVDERQDWRSQHRRLLRQALGQAPHYADAERLFDALPAAAGAQTIAAVAIASIEAVCDYFGLRPPRVVSIDALGVGGSGSTRVLEIVRRVGGTRYVTGHGARHYLDHAAFDRAGVAVNYMQYRCTPYPQFHGAFTPYVTVLDLVAQCGRAGRALINSGTCNWREFLDECHERV